MQVFREPRQKATLNSKSRISSSSSSIIDFCKVKYIVFVILQLEFAQRKKLSPTQDGLGNLL